MSQPAKDNVSDGVLLVGHGTRDQQGTRQFFDLASRLQQKLKPVPVEGCLLEFQHPTIAEGWQSLVDSGVSRIHVAPLLLFAAGHARSDIPDALAKCAAKSPGVTFRQCGPLSRAPSIIDLLSRRIGHALTTCDAATQQTGNPAVDASVALVMVGRGSHDPCAQADMRVLGAIVARRVGIAANDVAFYAMAQPRVPETLDRIAGRPGIRTIVVQPHLLFQGRLFDAIVQQVDDAARRHPSLRFVVGEYLGVTEEVAAALAKRIEFTS